MLREYAPLDFSLLQAGAAYAHPTQAAPERVTLEDNAQRAMTDLEP